MTKHDLTPFTPKALIRTPRLVKGVLGAAMISTALAFAPIAPAYARAAPDSFADLAEKVSPAVVMISYNFV